MEKRNIKTLFFLSFALDAVIFPTTNLGVMGLKISECPLDTALAYFPFTSGSILDGTGNANHPLILWNVRPAEDRFGKPDHALYFNGSAYLSGDATKFPKKDRTIALWWKAAATSPTAPTVTTDDTTATDADTLNSNSPVNSGQLNSNSNNPPAVSRNDSAGTGGGRGNSVLFGYGGGEGTCGTPFLMTLPRSFHSPASCYESQGQCSSNRILTCNDNETTTTTASATTAPPNFAFSPHPIWHHWAIAVSANFTRIYIDGRLVNTTDNHFMEETAVEGSYFSLGVNLPANGLPSSVTTSDGKSDYGYFTGYIDDVVIFNYSLSDYEIEKLAADNLPLVPSAKLSYGWLISLTFPVLLVSFFACYLLPPVNRKLRIPLIGRTPPWQKERYLYGSLGQ